MGSKLNTSGIGWTWWRSFPLQISYCLPIPHKPAFQWILSDFKEIMNFCNDYGEIKVTLCQWHRNSHCQYLKKHWYDLIVKVSRFLTSPPRLPYSAELLPNTILPSKVTSAQTCLSKHPSSVLIERSIDTVNPREYSPVLFVSIAWSMEEEHRQFLCERLS